MAGIVYVCWKQLENDELLVKMENFAYCSSFQPTSLRDFLQL